MGQRGRNRNGYYIALLHVLELQYERESRTKGSDPGRWQPSPHNRPDQFLRWVLDVLESLNFPPPHTFADVLRQLERDGLWHVASLLDHSIGSRVGARSSSAFSEVATRPLDSVLRQVDQPTRSLERHPQVRKFSKVVVQQLDAAWRKALLATARELFANGSPHRPALLLGGLPPSFAVLNERILGRLADTELVSHHGSLTVLQFYGLVTGTLPPAPRDWVPAISELEDLSRSDLELLGSLSDQRTRQLRAMTETAWRLLRARLRMRLTPARWSALGRTLAADEGADTLSAQRLASALWRQGMREASDHSLQELAASPAWEVAASFDEELARLISRGEISQRLVLRMQGWDDHTWSKVRSLLSEQRDTCVAWIEDRAITQELFVSRTGAQLHLRDLFPQTMAWLDDHLSAHLEDALVNDVAELETAATIVSNCIQEQFWRDIAARGRFRGRDDLPGHRPAGHFTHYGASD